MSDMNFDKLRRKGQGIRIRLYRSLIINIQCGDKHFKNKHSTNLTSRMLVNIHF